MGRQNLILGYPWLREWNPDVNWEMGSLEWRRSPRDTAEGTEQTPADEPIQLKYLDREPEGQEEARNSGGSPRKSREPALVAATVHEESPQMGVCRVFSPNEKGMDDLSTRPSGNGRPVNEAVESEFSIAEIAYEVNDEPMEGLESWIMVANPEGSDKDNHEELWIRFKTNNATTFAQKYATHEDKGPLPLEQQVPQEYHEYLNVFSEAKAARFPDSKSWDHKIDLKPDFEPKAFKAFRLPQDEVLLAEEFVKDNLAKGYIRPSKSPMSSPLFFVDKKDGKKRPCQDYQYLNDWTIKNAYPLPLIGDLIDGLQGMKYFTKLDIRWGYNNIRIRKGDEWKAAFRTPQGLYEPTVMFFGLCNSPATFQSIMDMIFMQEASEGWLKKYMDDLLIAAKTEKELQERTMQILCKLKENDLYLKPEKCEFCKTRIEYLGFIISQGKIEMDPKKIAGIADWPTPTTLRQLRSFLGFGNYYRKFIRGYADLTKPLNELLRKDIDFEWTTERNDIFNDLKRRFTTKPILSIPDQTKPFYIESDASKYATGAVLMQKDDNGTLHPCSYISQTFSLAERNYQIYDRELLGIIRALEEWKHYVLGSAHTTTIFTDHNNLRYYRSAQRLNRRQARWSLILSEYDLQLIHKPGKQMIQSDALSRRPDHTPDIDDDNTDMILLPDSIFVNLIDAELQERLTTLTEQQYDTDAIDALQNILAGKTESPDWTVRYTDDLNPLLYFQGRLYIPQDNQLRRELLQRYHDAPTAGHPGQLGTYHAISRHYWWPGLRSFVTEYVKGCTQCQQYKIDRHPTKPALQPIEPSGNIRPFSQISMDLITALPLAEGYDSILVVVDHGLSKGVILMATNETSNSEDIARLLHENLFRRFGLPDKIISDRDPRFASAAFQELLKLLEIKSAMSTAYHPQTDGATERSNQEIEAYLAIYCAQYPEDWPKALSTLEFSYNSRRHAFNKKSPFEIIMGLQPIAVPLLYQETNIPSTNERFRLMQQYRDDALSAFELSRNRMTQRIKANYVPFQIGEKVWLDTRNLKMKINSKLKPRKEGPFKIKKVLGKVTYELDLPEHWKVHPVFHAVLLSRYRETEQHGPNFVLTPHEVEGDELEYEVERILKHRKRGRMYQYLIRWKDQPATEDSWEPEENLENAPDVLRSYKKKNFSN